METLRYFVCRVGGLPVSAIDQLKGERCYAEFETIQTIEQELVILRDSLSGHLYDAIGQAENSKARNKLLKLRRDLFNLRRCTRQQVEAIFPHVSAEIHPKLLTYHTRLDHYHNQISTFNTVYEQDIITARKLFQTAITDADFQKGIMLSSDNLAHSVPKYTGKPLPAKLRKREAKVERSLLRYWTRMAMKTTPFSAFCSVVDGRFVDDAIRPTFTATPREKVSYIRLNKSLYSNILNFLVELDGVRQHMHVELNPTMRIVNGQFLFLSAVNGREVFQRIKVNAVLKLMADHFIHETSRPLGMMTNTLCRHPQIEASPEEATAYVDKLLSVGFMRFRTGIREQDPDWDIPLAAILDGIDHEAPRQISAMLKQLRQLSASYAAADVGERNTLMITARQVIEETHKAVEMPLPRKKVPFYEDCSAETQIQIPANQYDSALHHLETFAGILNNLAWPRAEQATMRHFFETYYQDVERVPLLQFYEDFYREHFKAHIEHERRQQMGQRPADGEEKYNLKNPFGLDEIGHIFKARKNINDLLIGKWRTSGGATQVNLFQHELETATEPIPPLPEDVTSLSLFLQTVPHFNGPEQGAFMMPGGSQLVGYGKYFSRFLYMFPPEVLAQLYSDNEALSGERIAEICGDAGFNANLHPPLLPWEISYPTGESGDADIQIRAASMVVGRDPLSAQKLALFMNGTNTRVLPVDLGFLNPRMRPPLYQLLSRFTQPANLSTGLPQALPLTEAEKETLKANPPTEPAPPTIQYRPRYVYENSIILGRQQWRVPAAIFPNMQPGETASDYFLRINKWRNEQQIPAQVYVRVHRGGGRMGAPQPPKKSPNGTVVQGDGATPAEPAAAVAEQVPQDGANGADPIAKTEAETTAKADAKQPSKRKQMPARSKDLYKPQYIDFESPLLVELFGRIGFGMQHFSVLIEECLPGKDHHIAHEDDQFVTELILQINRKAPQTQPHLQENANAVAA